ncbi:MAG: glycine--tRNA ligase subunit beta [Anaerolineae bacterium]|nr:glycine--tRNA ligase subunit beta [Caldilineales bacterium]MDW8267578.1 glycine--tRNA ligase subunit beta [Anaerolineae bacterium]
MLHSPSSLTFQDMIARLERFWAGQGCLIWQPYSEKVGAGTANPATTLRVLGPEPWRVGYVEPSYRPDDGRFAENPNRMQMHTQYQVILKPDPGNPQELYLDSLRALGIDLDRHDIRFVEDNWESPALGAWGLGWEVWLDGLEITQFTYFQQAGGLDLDPVAVELTYGLERIAMFLQGVREVWDLQWDEHHTYGDILKMQEIEHCEYAFHVADVERLQQLYELYEAEAKAAIARGLVIPAYDYVLRCSHTFNLLDTRGAVGVTERANYFRRMREMTHTVAKAYVEQRRRLEFPFLKGVGEAVAPVAPAPTPLPAGQEAADLVLEVGVEEMPPHDVRDAIAQLQSLVPTSLAAARLRHDGVRVTGTPRRLVVHVQRLAAQQAPETQIFRGPPAERAFDSLGQPTQAAIGFARSRGMSVEQLEVREEGGKRYVYAVQTVAGRPTYQLLPDLVREWVEALRFGKTMRWNRSRVSFSRPVRWLVALYGERVVPFVFADVLSDRLSRGLRPQGSPPLSIPTAERYFETVTAAGIVVDRDERRRQIAAALAQTAARVGGHVPPDEDLLDEVTDLVEQPLALLGSFDRSFLELPAPVLITVMKKHQRYFPVLAADGSMLPYFITIANGADRDPDLVRQGNEAVIRARYADAAYFVRQDRKRPLEDFNRDLAKLTFQEQLGSMLARVYRLEKLVEPVGERLGLTPAERALAKRAALLSKADLATSMVIEITSLQGIMGEIYALDSGEPPEVARAIREAYVVRPETPLSPIGLALNLATRLDGLVGLFAVGLAPRGANDPFGLRREALAIVQNLIAADKSFDVAAALADAAVLQPVPVSAGVLEEVAAFVRRRLYGVLREEGFGHEVTEAILAAQGNDPACARRAVADLDRAMAQPDWMATLTAYARCKRIVRGLETVYPLQPEADPEPATQALYAALAAAQARLGASRDVPTLVAVLADLRDPINAFFEAVLVMTDDPVRRAARLAVVQAIAALPDGIADLSVLPGF